MENIKDEILEIINTIPRDASPLEKVRYVYIKLGRIVYYDNMNVDDIINREVSLDAPYIEKYQTCTQICKILNDIFNMIDPNIKSEIIERRTSKRRSDRRHVANVVTIGEERYLLDLTLDLYLIQFGFRPVDFGFCDYMDMDLGFIPYSETDKIDEKLGLYPQGYTSSKLESIKEELANTDYSNMSFEEQVDYKINKTHELFNHEYGFAEGRDFIEEKILNLISVGCVERNSIRKDGNQKSIYIISKRDERVYYIYEGVFLRKSNIHEIKSLLDDGWYNKSGRLYDNIDVNITL